jgi:hypothetical protein
MIVDAIRNRNYLYGYDIYMRLAIGATHHTVEVTHCRTYTSRVMS